MALLCSALAWQREEGQRLALEFQASLAHRQVERAQRQAPTDGQSVKAEFQRWDGAFVSSRPVSPPRCRPSRRHGGGRG